MRRDVWRVTCSARLPKEPLVVFARAYAAAGAEVYNLDLEGPAEAAT